MSKLITIEIDPSDYGLGDFLDEQEAKHFLRLMKLAEEARRALRPVNASLALALGEALDRCLRHEKRLMDIV